MSTREFLFFRVNNIKVIVQTPITNKGFKFKTNPLENSKTNNFASLFKNQKYKKQLSFNKRRVVDRSLLVV